MRRRSGGRGSDRRQCRPRLRPLPRPIPADGAYAVNFADPLGNGRYVSRLSQGWQHGLAHIQSRPLAFTVALPIVGVGTPSPKAGTITLSEPSGSPDLASPLIVSGTNA